MEKLNAEQLRNLKYGDEVYRFTDGDFESFQFVGLMPSCKNYLILSKGEKLIHLHINKTNDLFYQEWYKGEYDSKFVGQLMIDWHNKQIESIKRIYLK